MPKISKLLQFLSCILLVVLITKWFLLGGVEEPKRIQSWYGMRKLLRFSGGIILIGSLVYRYALKRPQTIVGLTTMILAIVAILTPTLSKTFGMAYPARLETTKPSLTVRLPLNEMVIVTWGGDLVKNNYHAATPSQRWAYDMVVAPHGLRSENLGDYGCFGKTIVSPIEGTIINVINNNPDQTPSQHPILQANAFGNHVVIEPKNTATKLILAHMKEGSIIVKKGMVIKEGEPIGQCGNSGNTSEPHVHIHYAITQQAPNGLYYTTGLPLYFRDHSGTPMPTGGFKRVGKEVLWNNQGIQHIPQ